MQQGAQARDKILEILLDTTEVPLPAAIVDSEFESRKHEALHAFEHNEARLGQWLEQQGHTAEQFNTDLRNSAEETVKAQLLLDAIADTEDVSVTDNDLSERIMFQAQRKGVSPNDYALQLQKAGELGTVYADVRRGKALAAVLSQATITDASGNPVDIDSLIDSTTPGHAVAAR